MNTLMFVPQFGDSKIYKNVDGAICIYKGRQRHKSWNFNNTIINSLMYKELLNVSFNFLRMFLF